VNYLSLAREESVAKWGEIALEKRSGAPEHFFDPCRLISHPTPASQNPLRFQERGRRRVNPEGASRLEQTR